MVRKKPSMGRQKIEIKRINCEDSRQVTFSKRRSGLFKKASEICILCGVETAIIVFSPAGKAFSFGHPCVESIIDRYLTQSVSSDGFMLGNTYRGAGVRELSRQYTEFLNLFEAEKKRGVELLAKWRPGQYWWESPIDELGLDQLQQLKIAMDELQKTTSNRMEEMLFFETLASHPPFPAVNSIGMVNPTGNNASMIPPHGFGYGFGGGFL